MKARAASDTSRKLASGNRTVSGVAPYVLGSKGIVPIAGGGRGVGARK